MSDRKSKSFENQESYRLIKFRYGNETFSLQLIFKEDILKAVIKLPSDKACISKVVKIFTKAFFCEKLKDTANKYLQENKYPDLMKKAEITSVFKKNITPLKKIVVQSVLYPILQRSSEVSFSYN